MILTRPRDPICQPDGEIAMRLGEVTVVIRPAQLLQTRRMAGLFILKQCTACPTRCLRALGPTPISPEAR